MTDLNLDVIENRLDFGHHDSWALLAEARRLRELVALREREISALNGVKKSDIQFVVVMAYTAGLAAAGHYVTPGANEIKTVCDSVARMLDLVNSKTVSADVALGSLQKAMRTCAKKDLGPITMTESELEKLASDYDEDDVEILSSAAPHKDLRDLAHDDPSVRKEAMKKHVRSLFKVVPDPA